MSHIHLPDGVLPAWLWILGFAGLAAAWWILFRRVPLERWTRRLPLVGMMAAAMVLGASAEIVPIAYHVNLTVVSGILLGPSMVFLATLVVNVILALFGHGGVTVIGLNTLILGAEGIAGYYLFRGLMRVFRKLTPAVFLATFLALMLSTFSMIGVVWLGTSHYEQLMHHEEGGGLFEFGLGKEKGDHGQKEGHAGEVNLARFVAIILPLGFIGWVVEGVITTLIVRYLYRLRPDLLDLGARPT